MVDKGKKCEALDKRELTGISQKSVKPLSMVDKEKQMWSSWQYLIWIFLKSVNPLTVVDKKIKMWSSWQERVDRIIPRKCQAPDYGWQENKNVNLLTRERVDRNIPRKCQATDYGWQGKKMWSSWQELTRISLSSVKLLTMVDENKCETLDKDWHEYHQKKSVKPLPLIDKKK